MACLPCAAVLLAADAVDMPQLVRTARSMRGQALAFCDGCRHDHGADAAGGLGSLEVVHALVNDLAADAPAEDLKWALLYSPADGSIAYRLQRGRAMAYGTLPAGMDPAEAQAFIVRQALAAGVVLPPDFVLVLPDAATPASQGAVPAAYLLPPPKASREDEEHAHRLRLIAFASLGLLVAVLLWLSIPLPEVKHL